MSLIELKLNSNVNNVDVTLEKTSKPTVLLNKFQIFQNMVNRSYEDINRYFLSYLLSR